MAWYLCAACSVLIMQCASLQREGSDPLTREIDDGLNVILYTDLSLQNIQSFLLSARTIAVKQSYAYQKSAGAEYVALLNKILATVGESCYGDISVMDKSSAKWPGTLAVKMADKGEAMALPLPAIDADAWGLSSLRNNAGALEQGRSYKEQASTIDGIIERIILERMKLRVYFERLLLRKKAHRARLLSQPMDGVIKEIAARMDELTLQLKKGDQGQGSMDIYKLEMDQLKEEMKLLGEGN